MKQPMFLIWISIVSIICLIIVGCGNGDPVSGNDPVSVKYTVSNFKEKKDGSFKFKYSMEITNTSKEDISIRVHVPDNNDQNYELGSGKSIAFETVSSTKKGENEIEYQIYVKGLEAPITGIIKASDDQVRQGRRPN